MATVIEPVSADDRATMDGWFALEVRSHEHDTPELPPPCPLGHATRFSWPGFDKRAWVVRSGPDVVAAAQVTLPQRDNLTGGFAQVLVAPEQRRRGLGTRLLRHLVTQARHAGRTHLALGAGRPLDGPSTRSRRGVPARRRSQARHGRDAPAARSARRPAAAA